MSPKMMDGRSFAYYFWDFMVNHKRYSTLCMHDNYLSAVMKLFIALGFEVQAGGAYEARKRGSER